MSDIVERLRGPLPRGVLGEDFAVCVERDEAAEEIIKLRKQVEGLEAEIEAVRQYSKLYGELADKRAVRIAELESLKRRQ